MCILTFFIIILILIHFLKDWTIKAIDDKPMTAINDINAPDLYVPLMAFLTYILVAGFVFGVQKRYVAINLLTPLFIYFTYFLNANYFHFYLMLFRFTPEKLGMLATNTLFYLTIENVVIFITKYILNISQSLNIWHALAYSAYKFVGYVF